MTDAAEATAPAPAPAASTSAAPAPDAALDASSLAPVDDALLARTERAFVRDGDNVLLKLPSGILKPVKITPNGTVGLGKYGTFKGRELIGRPYGHTYEIGEDGKLSVLQATLNEIEETAANNEFITSAGAQTLSFVDIKALKESGLSGREIIQKQIEEHKSYELKTEYSKEKYLKRKEAKWMQLFTPLEPTVHELAQYHFEKQPSRTRELRPDTLANMLAMANVRPGSKLLVVEDLGGMIVAAAVERMGGEGRIMVINDADSPPDLHLLDSFNFSASALAPIASLHWAATSTTWTPPDLPLELADLDRSDAAAGVAQQLPPGTKAPKRNSRDVQKLRKRKAAFDKAKEARDEYFAGGFDGVIIASEYEPYSVVERLLPRIGGSAPIVIYSPHLPLLFNALQRFRSHPSLLAPTIHEPFLRRYQVLPGRTHPEMQGMASGGFVLNMVRVYENELANAAGVGGRGRAKRKAPTAQAGAEKGEEKGKELKKEGKEDEPAAKKAKVDEEEKGAEEAATEGEAMQVEPVAAPAEEAA
ncbi:tRNA 1-methyladenosine methyltransferase subunit GCD10 [Rhodotorula paludigena]|uniref:tRNA 1-methyladenosine methyltransferase subunit GCD10 n=1 Tax=Rhodotorula paludigena TaxID=86838 RepID=UPI00317B81D6